MFTKISNQLCFGRHFCPSIPDVLFVSTSDDPVSVEKGFCCTSFLSRLCCSGNAAINIAFVSYKASWRRGNLHQETEIKGYIPRKVMWNICAILSLLFLSWTIVLWKKRVCIVSTSGKWCSGRCRELVRLLAGGNGERWTIFPQILNFSESVENLVSRLFVI